MKLLLLLLAVLLLPLVSCTSPSGVMMRTPAGVEIAMVEPAQLGGKRTAAYNINPRTGAMKMMVSQNNENSFDTFATVMGVGYGAALETKEILANTAAGVSNTKTAGRVTMFGLGQQTKEKAIEAGLSSQAIEKGITTIPR